jgi:hypothetical protein
MALDATADADDKIIDLWTSEFLKDFCDCRPKSAGNAGTSKPHVAFGRTVHEIDPKPYRVQSIRPQTVPILSRSNSGNGSGRGLNHVTLHLPTKLSDSRIQQTNEYLTRISELDSKVRGSQMLNFKIDLSKAREKRKRQLQYAYEIKSGSTSLQSREIDSVTRIVVQSFRNLIDCERCALFLMDEKTNELYFKPVGDSEHSQARLKEIRFPASSGVAGWVASNKKMLNLKNAYHDARFNPDVDKKTGFRTRTILCHPVLSSNNQLLGVIQMVNKKKTNPKKLQDEDKKKGYQSCFEHFSAEDEEILGKCCLEVSKSLQEIFSQQDPKKTESKTDEKRNVVFYSDEGVNSPLMSRCVARLRQVKVETGNDHGSVGQSTGQSTDDDSSTYVPERQRRDSMKRRSSVGAGQLAQFIKQHSTKDPSEGRDVESATGSGGGIAEAVQKFRFRAPDSDTMRHREVANRPGDTGLSIAEMKRKRMKDYSQRISPVSLHRDPARRRSSVDHISSAMPNERMTATVNERLQRSQSDPDLNASKST